LSLAVVAVALTEVEVVVVEQVAMFPMLLESNKEAAGQCPLLSLSPLKTTQ
jgi:hypothetical protein